MADEPRSSTGRTLLTIAVVAVASLIAAACASEETNEQEPAAPGTAASIQESEVVAATTSTVAVHADELPSAATAAAVHADELPSATTAASEQQTTVPDEAPATSTTTTTVAPLIRPLVISDTLTRCVGLDYDAAAGHLAVLAGTDADGFYEPVVSGGADSCEQIKVAWDEIRKTETTRANEGQYPCEYAAAYNYRLDQTLTDYLWVPETRPW